MSLTNVPISLNHIFINISVCFNVYVPGIMCYLIYLSTNSSKHLFTNVVKILGCSDPNTNAMHKYILSHSTTDVLPWHVQMSVMNWCPVIIWCLVIYLLQYQFSIEFELRANVVCEMARGAILATCIDFIPSIDKPSRAQYSVCWNSQTTTTVEWRLRMDR